MIFGLNLLISFNEMLYYTSYLILKYSTCHILLPGNFVVYIIVMIVPFWRAK